MKEGKNKIPKIVFMVSDTLLTYMDGSLNDKAMEQITFVLSNLNNSGKHVALVTAGAIVLGAEKVQMKERPASLSEKQALAAIGQVGLMKAYQKHFNDFNQIVAQVLLTRKVILREGRKERAYDTLNQLFSMGIIPIINENDSVSTVDIELEDNYPLALDIAELVNADLIVVTSDIKSRYNVLQCGSFKANIVDSEEELYEVIEHLLENPAKREKSKPAFPQSLTEINFSDE
ncbi:MAG: glutamate 5-kinase [Bacteroidota bacterium]